MTDLLAARQNRWDSTVLGFTKLKAQDGTALLVPRSQLQLSAGTYVWPAHPEQMLEIEEE